jgi:heme-degrading monooxygenase HmoA
MLLRHFLRALTMVVAMGLIAIACWGSAVSPAQADKFMKSMPLDDTSGGVEVLTIYKTSVATQKMLSKSLKTASKPMKKAMGFKGLSLLQSQDGEQLVAFSQWEDLESFQTYAASLTSTPSQYKSLGSGFAPPEPSQTLTLKIIEAQTAIAGATPAIRGREPVVQFVQLTGKTPDAQPLVLDALKSTIPDLLQQQPIPQSILLLKHPESGDYSLLSIWNCSAMFEDVGSPTVIELSEDLLALADSDQHIYDVVTILPAPTKQDKEKGYGYY